MNDGSFIILSIISLIIGLWFFNKKKQPKAITGVCFVMVFSSIILFIAYGVATYFTGNGIDEATIYHLKYGLDGAGFLEYKGLIVTTIMAFILGAFYLSRIISKRNKDKETHNINGLLSFIFLFISLLLNPASLDIYNLQKESLIFANHSNLQIPTSFYEYYNKPYIKAVENNHKNLVFIYAESLEQTYFDETLFPGLINGLRELESKSTYFTNIKQVAGTGWTVGGMTASLCGIPLFTPSHGNSMSGMDHFLPSAVGFGDLLNESGYQLNYMGGASLDFAGKGKLLKTHGFTNVMGRDELLPKLENKTYRTSWGLYDDSLFDMAYNRFIELSEVGNKFGLFMLTLDTHHPNGHPSASCKDIKYKDGSNPILNAVACSDHLISMFINKIAQSPYADNTIVVLVSDHLAMRNTASDLLQSKDRRNLFMIIDPSKNNSNEIKTVGSTLDIGPTVLPFLGYTGDIGLGRNLLNDEMPEEDRLFIHSNLRKWRQPIEAFWDFPKIQDDLKINVDSQIVSIDGRNFRMPILVELNNMLETTLKFQFNASSGHKSLVEHRKELGRDSYFLLIDKCCNARELDNSLGKKGFCLLAGQGKKYTKITKLNNDIKYTANEIRQLLNIPNAFIAHRVAHAGGGINDKAYTNSFEALDFNIKKGFQYFELDFSFTKDNRLVCLHDWKHSFKRSFGFEIEGRVTLKEFESLVKNKSEFNKCTIDGLSVWMSNNPSAYIVTDVKDNNIKALKTMLEILPNAKRRVIPQIYNPNNYSEVKKLGFEQIIWTLYRVPSMSNEEIVDWVRKFDGPFAITMPEKRAKSILPRQLKKMNVPSYVSTINSPEKSDEYLRIFGVTEIYTDFLQPKRSK